MKLSQLYANKSFKHVKFNDGLNLVLAKVTKKLDLNKDSHGLGKSTLIEVLDFMLLKEIKGEDTFKKHKAIFADYDAVIMPTSPTTAFTIGQKNSDPIAVYLADIFTVFANLTGIPGMSVPLFKHSNGMPFGLQIMTKKEDELTLLQMANYLLKQQQLN